MKPLLYLLLTPGRALDAKRARQDHPLSGKGDESAECARDSFSRLVAGARDAGKGAVRGSLFI